MRFLTTRVLPDIQTAGDDVDLSLDCLPAAVNGESHSLCSSPADEASHPAFCFAKQSEGFNVALCVSESQK